MCRFRAFLRRSLASLAALLMFASVCPAMAQRAMPDAAPLSNFNPLCDSTLVHCLEIDDFAGHFYGHLQVLPQTDHRDTAAVFPLGVTLELFGRVAGGISSYYSFWHEKDALYQQLGPLRLSLSGRLLPLFSPSSAEGNTPSGDPAYEPPRSFQLGLAYEQEVRVGPFSGANSLGFLTDLASLTIIGSKPLGPVHVSASVGALYDWRGTFVTPVVAAQLGLFLPGFKQLKVFAEGMVRGFVAHVNLDALPQNPNGQDLIHAQGMFGGGLSFHSHKRVDFGVTVDRGFGGLAPWIVSVNFLVLSVGKTYQGRAATPLAETAADVAAAFVSWSIEKWKTIDPYLKKDCVLYDDNHRPIKKLGELSPDGKACLYQGLAVPIGPHFWHNDGDTVLCYDQRLHNCFLSRSDRDAAWEPIHPLLVHNDCFAYYNGQPWMRIGKPSADKQTCENDGHAIPVGQALNPDHDHTRYYCYEEPDKARNQTRKSFCFERPEQAQSDGKYLGRRFAEGIDRSKESLDRSSDRIHQVIDEGAAGVPLHATTPVQEAVDAGKATLDHLKNVTDEDAKKTFYGVLKATKDWFKKPLLEQAGDIADDLGDAAASPSTYLPAGALLGEGKIALEGAHLSEDAAKAGKQATKAANHAEHALKDGVDAERKAAQAVRSAEHGAERSHAAEGLLKKHEDGGGHTIGRHTGKSDAELMERLKQDEKISGASTFPDEATAEHVVGNVLEANKKEIDAWLNSNAKAPLSLEYKGNTVIGRGIMRGESTVKDRTEAFILLKKDKGGGYHVHTAYPQ